MTNPVTETIDVTYYGGEFTFADQHGNSILNGDLSAYPGANSFTFQPASGQTWRFVSARITSTAALGCSSTMGLDDSFRITIASLQNPTTQFVVEDNNRESAEQEYEYTFQIKLTDGTVVTCDPKIYNRIG